jgi:YHS domain-containing protein
MKRMKFVSVLVMVGLLLIFQVVLPGCKKKTAQTLPTETQNLASAAGEQTICPVMGNPIDKRFYTEYKGKKVYFCCAQCKGDFEKNPEKYLSKLPQFAK